MQQKKAFIVDDEFQSRSFLNALLQQYFPGITVVGQASTVEEGTKGIEAY